MSSSPHTAPSNFQVLTQTNIIKNKTVETVDHHHHSGGGLITVHNIVLNCLIISSLTITGLIEYSQVSGLKRREERWRGGDVGCQFNSQSICHLPGWTMLDISLSIPRHIPAPPDYTILARIDELLPSSCPLLSALLPPSYTS